MKKSATPADRGAPGSHAARPQPEAGSKLISAILDAAKDLLVVVLDPKGRISHFNKACRQCSGYSLKEVRGRSIWDFLIPPEDEKALREVFRGLAQGRANRNENDWLTKDGRRIRIRWSNNVYKGDSGKVESIIATGMDVTDRQQSEQAATGYREQLAAEFSALARLYKASQRLWRCHELHAGMEEMIDAGTALLGAQLGSIQLWNPAKQVLEMAAQRGFSARVVARLREIPSNAGTASARSLRSRKRVVVEDVELDAEFEPYRDLAAGAGFRAVQSTPLLGPAGQVIGVFCTYFRDPHRPLAPELRRFDLYAQQAAEFIERVRAEEQLRHSEATIHALLETAAQGILAHDENGCIVLANHAAANMFGLPAERLRGRLLESLMPEPYRERHVQHRAAWVGKPPSRPMGIGLDLSGVHKDGTRFPIEVSLSSIHSPNGKLGVAFVTDITERKKNEQALLDYKDQLQKLSGALLSAQEAGNRAIARELHDVLSQDLAAVGLELSALKEKLDPGHSAAARLTELQHRIGRLSEDVHRTSRELHPAILDELGVEAALEHECDSFGERSGIPVRFMADGNSAAVPGEVALCLYRVAQESLRNVQKHSAEARSAIVELAVGRDRVILQVTDSGDGFDLEQALKKGGLGLISMEERVRLVHGSLSIQSKPGHGTVVTAVIPLTPLSS